MLGLEAMEETVPIDKRICVNCDSKTTYLDSRNQYHWYNHEGDWWCNKCHEKVFVHPIKDPKLMLFKNKRVPLEENPRKGICKLCGAKKGDTYINKKGKSSIVKTHIHHIEYHDDDPLEDTIELCHSCHSSQPKNKGRGLFL